MCFILISDNARHSNRESATVLRKRRATLHIYSNKPKIHEPSRKRCLGSKEYLPILRPSDVGTTVLISQ